MGRHEAILILVARVGCRKSLLICHVVRSSLGRDDGDGDGTTLVEGFVLIWVVNQLRRKAVLVWIARRDQFGESYNHIYYCCNDLFFFSCTVTIGEVRSNYDINLICWQPIGARRITVAPYLPHSKHGSLLNQWQSCRTAGIFLKAYVRAHVSIPRTVPTVSGMPCKAFVRYSVRIAIASSCQHLACSLISSSLYWDRSLCFLLGEPWVYFYCDWFYHPGRQ